MKSCATAFDGRCPPQQFVWGNRRIVQNDTVAAGNQMTRSRTRGLLHYAVSKESAVARIEHDFTFGDFLEACAVNGEEVTGRSPGWTAGVMLVPVTRKRTHPDSRTVSETRSQARAFKSSTSWPTNQKEADYDAFRLLAHCACDGLISPQESANASKTRSERTAGFWYGFFTADSGGLDFVASAWRSL